jgi:hypothetical protein
MGTGKGIENFRNIGCKNGQEIARAWDPGNQPECKEDLKLGKGIGSYQTGTRCLNFTSSFFLSSPRLMDIIEDLEFFNTSFLRRDDLSFAPPFMTWSA